MTLDYVGLSMMKSEKWALLECLWSSDADGISDCLSLSALPAYDLHGNNAVVSMGNTMTAAILAARQTLSRTLPLWWV